MTDATAVRPLRVWPTPSHRSKQVRAGHYWHWECRICGDGTKDLIPSLPAAYDDALCHLCRHGGDGNGHG